ncbi:MAG: hypothetical protein EAX95_08030 [Candidatus Thorarchaeota archaeon]|nr:hypothetical protein [Candidatus Thorarchaeota archaeon]
MKHYALNNIAAAIKRNSLLIVILLAGAVVWVWVFNEAAIDFVTNGTRPFRAAWNGYGELDVFGYTIHLNFEGWADHDYFYHSWAEQFLSGELPYTTEFDTIIVNSNSFNVPYFFPPLYLYICVIGKIIHPDLGIGFIITLFGFITVFPVHGIAAFLSGNQHVGDTAAATYLFSPIVLYYTTFDWLNPAPFVFFAMLSFLLLMKDYRIAGAISMTMSAFFKQTAFFFALPLFAYLLRRPPKKSKQRDDKTPEEESENSDDKLDLLGFAKIAIVVIIYAGIASLPYILDPANYLYNILQRAGATRLRSFTELPASNSPITIAALFVVGGIQAQATPFEPFVPLLQWLAEATDLLNYYSILLMLGLIPILLLLLLEVKNDNNLRGYWRRLLYLTFLLMLCVHLFSPRGIYKYYTVVLAPFFSILSVSALCNRDSSKVRVSLPMLVNPFILALAIMIPDRNLYLLYLVLILFAYLLRSAFSDTYNLLARPVRIGLRSVVSRFNPRPQELPESPSSLDALEET